MTENERKQLATRLAQMENNERQRLLKRAALMKKATRPPTVKARPGRFDVDDDDQPVLVKRRALSLDDYVWKLLAEEEGIDAAGDRSSANQSESQTSLGAREGELSGTVVSIGPRVCEVSIDGQLTLCSLSPDLAARQQTELAVGDVAALEKRGRDTVVLAVLPRRTKLSRPDAGNANLERVIVANVDTVVVVVSVVSPPLHPRLIDRYLIAIQRGGATPVIAVNKLDLHESEEALAEDLERLAPYRALGVPVVLCSAASNRGRDELLEALKGRVSAFVGHSGVGKSSLLNMVRPDLSLKTGEVSHGQGRGTHTTTRSTLIDLGDGTRVIDTPGIRSFGLWNLKEDELPWYFPEFAAVARCKFGNCTHTHEPGCSVKEAVEDGRIAGDRYDTYLRIKATLGK